MTGYEYKVVPAPHRGIKARRLRGTAARFAHALELVINDMAAEGWQYLRAETLPCEERQGLGRRATSFQNLLVFRRPLQADTARPAAQTHAPAPDEPPLSRRRPAGPEHPVDSADTPDSAAEAPETAEADSAAPAEPAEAEAPDTADSPSGRG